MGALPLAMTDSPRPAPQGAADPTRDIRLPPLPDRQPPSLPPEWRSEEAGSPPPPEVAEPAAVAPDEPQFDQPTDELGAPPPDRHPTLTFDGAASERWKAGLAATPDPVWSPLSPAGRPVVGARPRERSRRWPWVVLTLLPVLIIVGTGIWLLLLLRG
jgi:hypothetical protein